MVFKIIIRTLCSSHAHFDSKFIKNIASLNKKERFELLSKDFAIKKPKNTLKQEKKVYEIWLGMNLEDIAKATGKMMNEVREALRYVNGAENLSLKDSINDPKLLNQIFKIFGGKTILVPKNETNVIIPHHIKDFMRKPLPKKECFKRRCPIVVIMGHVDHGKTTLLDQIRKTSMVDKEFGGITQHIGAFSVRISRQHSTPGGGGGDTTDAITFLDTPGHAAFSAMRSRGAHVTDLAILVVGADDGVMDQTVESIKFAQEAKVPIIVAINKIDKEKIDVERVKKQLLGYGVCVEEYGGEVQAITLSALKGQNIEGLLEAVLAQAEVMDITADYDGPVEGVVIESRLDKNRGILSTVLIQRGTLKKGNILISLDENNSSQKSSVLESGNTATQPKLHQSSANQAPATWCKVRAMFDDSGRTVTRVMPGYPVEVIGWKGLPNVGTPIYEVESEERAREIVHYRMDIEKADKLEQDWKVIEEERRKHLINYNRDVKVKKALNYSKLPKSLSAQHNPKLSLTETMDTGPQKPRLSIVVKGDVIGSIEAILDLLATYDESTNACHLDVLHYGIGPVTPFDVELAQTFKGIIYAFNVDSSVDQKSSGVTIKKHNVIYKLIDDLILEMTQKLEPVEVEEILGEAGVNQEFVVSEGKAKIPVAGCIVDSGTFTKKCTHVHVIRGDRLIHKGSIKSLKHFKNDVESVKKGSECGVVLEDLTVRYKPGDVIRAISLKKIPGKIVWNLGF